MYIRVQIVCWQLASLILRCHRLQVQHRLQVNLQQNVSKNADDYCSSCSLREKFPRGAADTTFACSCAVDAYITCAEGIDSCEQCI